MYTFSRTIEETEKEYLERDGYEYISPNVAISYPEVEERAASIDDMIIMFKSFLIALGYHPNRVESIQMQDE